MADQSSRSIHQDKEAQTRQGMYCLTASGKLLAYRNSQDTDAVRAMLEKGLAEWKSLPESERRAGAVKVPDSGKADHQFARTLPAGGLVLNVFTRILDRKSDGKYVCGSCAFAGGELPGRDHLWLMQSEWQSLIAAATKKGQQFDMPAAVADRLLRHHLVDNTRGEPPSWARKDVRKKTLRWTVLQADDKAVRLRLEGSALLATDGNVAKAKRGYEARLLGYLHYDAVRKIIDRFDVVAVGEHWGEGPYTGGARPGRQPLGIALELASGDRPSDKIPPQSARNLGDYLGHER